MAWSQGALRVRCLGWTPRAEWGNRLGPWTLSAPGSDQLGLASILRPWPPLPTATWPTGFPPCLGHELTSAPLTGRGEVWAGHKPPTVPGPHPPPFPGTMAQTQPAATAGGGVVMSMRRGKGGVQGGGPPGPPPALILHLACIPLVLLLPSWVALKGGGEKRGGGFLSVAPIPSCLGQDSVWLLLKTGNKGPN